MSKGKPIPLYNLKPYGWSEEHSSLHCVLFYHGYLLIGSGDGQIFWYSLNSLRPEKRCISNLGSSCLQLLYSRNLLISQSKVGDICIWRQREDCTWFRESKVETNHIGFCRMQALEVGDSKEVIACASGQAELNVYDVTQGKFEEVCQLKLDPSEKTRVGIVTCCCCVGNNKAVTLHEANVMYLWDIRQPCKPCSTFEMKDMLQEDVEDCPVPVTVHFDFNMNRGVYGGMTDALGTFTTDGVVLKQHKMKYPLKMTNKGALSVVVQPTELAATKSRIMTVGCSDGCLRVYSWSTGRPLAVMPHSEKLISVHDVAFSPSPVESLSSKMVMAAAGADGCVSFWDADFTKNM